MIGFDRNIVNYPVEALRWRFGSNNKVIIASGYPTQSIPIIHPFAVSEIGVGGAGVSVSALQIVYKRSISISSEIRTLHHNEVVLYTYYCVLHTGEYQRRL